MHGHRVYQAVLHGVEAQLSEGIPCGVNFASNFTTQRVQGLGYKTHLRTNLDSLGVSAREGCRQPF